jgi:hypothetical protein
VCYNATASNYVYYLTTDESGWGFINSTYVASQATLMTDYFALVLLDTTT